MKYFIWHKWPCDKGKMTCYVNSEEELKEHAREEDIIVLCDLDQ